MKYLLYISVVAFLFARCSMPHNSEKSKPMDLIDFSGYRQFQTFDISRMTGCGLANDTTFVYVKSLGDTIEVRLSENTSNPIVFYKYCCPIKVFD